MCRQVNTLTFCPKGTLLNKRRHLYIIFITYLLLLCAVLFARKGDRLGFGLSAIRSRLATNANFVPFATTGAFRRAAATGRIAFGLYVLNVYGNALLFLPFGLLLPRLRSISSTRHPACLSCILSLCAIIAAESVQLCLGIGRADIDDIILNFAGAAVGVLISRSTMLIRKK